MWRVLPSESRDNETSFSSCHLCHQFCRRCLPWTQHVSYLVSRSMVMVWGGFSSLILVSVLTQTSSCCQLPCSDDRWYRSVTMGWSSLVSRWFWCWPVDSLSAVDGRQRCCWQEAVPSTFHLLLVFIALSERSNFRFCFRTAKGRRQNSWFSLRVRLTWSNTVSSLSLDSNNLATTQGHLWPKASNMGWQELGCSLCSNCFLLSNIGWPE